MNRRTVILLVAASTPACIAPPMVIGESLGDTDVAAGSSDTGVGDATEGGSSAGGPATATDDGGSDSAGDPCSAGCEDLADTVPLDRRAHALELGVDGTPVVLFARPDEAPLVQRFSEALVGADAVALDVPAQGTFAAFVISPRGRAGVVFVIDGQRLEIDRLEDDLVHTRWSTTDDLDPSFEGTEIELRVDAVQIPIDDSVRVAASFAMASGGGGYRLQHYVDPVGEWGWGFAGSMPGADCSGMYLLSDGDTAVPLITSIAWSADDQGGPAHTLWTTGSAGVEIPAVAPHRAPPTRWRHGYVQSGAASNDGGIWLQEVSSDFTALPPVFDVDTDAPYQPVPVRTIALRDDLLVFAEQPDDERVALTLRRYGTDLALLDVVELAPLATNAVSSVLIDVAVDDDDDFSVDGVAYVLGRDRRADGTTVDWLRRLSLPLD